MTKLNENQMEKVKHVFDLYGNAKQKLEYKDFGTAVRALGIPLTDGEIEDIIKDMKTIGNENFDLPEFVSLIANYYTQFDVNQELEESFQIFHRKNTGQIDVKEMLFVFSNLCKKLNKRDIEMLMAEEDLGDKKTLNLEEFLKLMT